MHGSHEFTPNHSDTKIKNIGVVDIELVAEYLDDEVTIILRPDEEMFLDLGVPYRIRGMADYCQGKFVIEAPC